MLLIGIAVAGFMMPPNENVVRGWLILSEENRCTAERTFEDGTIVTFGLSHDQEDSHITLWNDRWQSIQKDADYQISVQFDGNPATTFDGSGMKTSKSGGIYITTSGALTIAAAMNAKTVRFRNGNKQIGLYSLDGSYKAMLAVSRCNGKSANATIEDPFSE